MEKVVRGYTFQTPACGLPKENLIRYATAAQGQMRELQLTPCNQGPYRLMQWELLASSRADWTPSSIKLPVPATGSRSEHPVRAHKVGGLTEESEPRLASGSCATPRGTAGVQGTGHAKG